MKITKEWLKNENACSEGYEWFLNQEDTDAIKLIKKLNKENHFDWANWLLTRLFNKDDNIRYAIYATELVLYIFEEKYPNDNRPRKAIEAAKDYLKNKDAAVAYAAANAAANAAYVAAASYVAYATANAAVATAYAANAAVYAANATTVVADDVVAYAAADNAVYAVYTADVENKIIEYGISLLQKKEN